MNAEISQHRTAPERGGADALLARAGARARALPASASNASEDSEAARLSDLLLTRGAVPASEIDAALSAMRGTSLSLGQVLLTQGVLSEAELLSALAQIHRCGIADLSDRPADQTLAPLLSARAAIAAEAVIWHRAGSALVIATSRPDRIEELDAQLPRGTRIVPALASRAQIAEAQRQLFGDRLAREAEGRAPQRYSCRSWRGDAMGQTILAAALAALSLFLVAPVLLAGLAFGLAIAVFITNCILKFSALAHSMRGDRNAGNETADETAFSLLHLPTVSILVPLLREPEVAGALVDRLRQIDYPRERLDIILAVEENDPLTLVALRAGTLPPWMRAVIVPSGHPQTKPRALNYALRYARGEFVGIYDAEDRPEQDQIYRIVRRFAELPANVACLQGRLDYYNSRHNWLAALFTVEYAAWFRVLLPGVQRMGLVVPLGGTTVFLRRQVLEQVGAWDAHNVTEDAELGLRLSRAGYETQIVETTTFEEANAALGPWIRQRSRWLKGYLMTWGAAMRCPGQLWSDLGPRRFIGLQVQFFGAVLGFLTAPLLWSFMLKPFGFWHPLDPLMPPLGYGILAAIMITALIGSIAVSIYACRAPHLRHLLPIAPLVEPYYLFGTIAAWIGLFEMMARPFFWAKTTHGRFGAAKSGAAENLSSPELPRAVEPVQER